jgi:hypothetical protein
MTQRFAAKVLPNWLADAFGTVYGTFVAWQLENRWKA